MSSGALTEWLPTLGESWQIVHDPTNESGTVTPLANVAPLRPATPLIVNAFVLKMVSPRAIACRVSVSRSGGEPLSRVHAANRVNTFGSNDAPVGFSPTGSLIPTKNACLESALGPPCAPSDRRLPARRSRTCAVNNLVSN